MLVSPAKWSDVSGVGEADEDVCLHELSERNQNESVTVAFIRQNTDL